MGTSKDSEKTRAQLIEAAGSLFAEKGYKTVTVREIAQTAKTHLSAMNYHFHSKDALYRTVVETACREEWLSEQEQSELLALEPIPALEILISESVNYFRAQQDQRWQSKLLTRESRNPTTLFSEITNEYFKQQADYLSSILGRAVSKSPDDPQVRLAIVVLTSNFDTFGEYESLVDAMAPGLIAFLDQDDRLSAELLRITLLIARG